MTKVEEYLQSPMWKHMQSRNAEYEAFVAENPKDTIRFIEALKVEIGELTQRVVDLQDALYDEVERRGES